MNDGLYEFCVVLWGIIGIITFLVRLCQTWGPVHGDDYCIAMAAGVFWPIVLAYLLAKGFFLMLHGEFWS